MAKKKAAKKRATTKKKTTRQSSWKKLRFEGLKVCFTGKPEPYGAERKEYEQWAADDGAEILKTLNATADMLVVLEKGATAGTEKKAQGLNKKGASIAIISESDFTDRFLPNHDEVVELVAAGKKGRERLNHLIDRSQCCYYGRSEAIDLTGANLRKTDLADVNLRAFKLDGADLREANVSTAEAAILKNVRMEKAHGDHLRPAGMVHCNCKGAKLPSIFMGYHSYSNKETVADCDFTNANLDDGYFSYLQIERTSFKNAVLTETDFVRSRLTDVDLSSADLSKADLNEMVCKSNVVFTKAKLCEANLEHADMSGADLRNADLTGARLSGTNFKNADVAGAKFHNAIVIGANFDGVDISKAKGLTLHPTTPVKLGKASTELAKVAKKAQEMLISATVQMEKGTVSIRVSRGWNSFASGYELHVDDKVTRDSQGQTSCNKALTAIGETWGHGKLKFDTIKVTSSKSPVKGKALQELAAQALAEAFNDEVPTADQLKEQRKKTKENESNIKQDLLDELRGGKKGVDQFNKRNKDALVRKKQHRLRKEDFSGAKLGGVSAPNFDFQSCNFEKASFRSAKLENADFRKSNMREASLRFAKMSLTNLSDCDLSSADMQKVDLSYADLRRANFDQADLTGANLNGANLEGAQLAKAIAKNVKWENSQFDENTKFPKGFKIPKDFYFTGKGHDPRIVAKLPSAPDKVSDFESFMERLNATVDQSRLKKSLKMLKADSFQLFSEVTDEAFVGVVKSQTDASLVYSCRLSADGEFACCTQNLNSCGGLRGALCKHLLVLIVGLTKGGKLDANSAATWAHESLIKNPELNKDLMSEVLLKYKGAEAGEVDWRPMETIPEDYYTL